MDGAEISRMSGCCIGRKEKDMSRTMCRRFCFVNFVGFVVLFALIAATAYVGTRAFQDGLYQRTVKGYDSFGNTCDRDNRRIKNVPMSGYNMKNDRILFFLNPYRPWVSRRICVNTCPDHLMETPNNVYKFTLETDSRLCLYPVPLDKYDEDASTVKIYNRSGRGLCPKLPIDKSAVLLNHCVPTTVPRVLIEYLNSRLDIISLIVRDVYTAWPNLMFVGLASLATSYLTLMVFSFLASVKIFVLILLFSLTSIVGCGFLWWMFWSLHTLVREETSRGRVTVDVHYYNRNACLTLAIIVSVAIAFVFSYMLSHRKKFSLANSVLNATTKLLRGKLFIFIIGLPLLGTAPLVVWLIYWIFVQLYLPSIERPEVDVHSEVTFVREVWVTVTWWLHLFLLFPVASTAIAFQRFVTAGVVYGVYMGRRENSVLRHVWLLLSQAGVVHVTSVALSLLTFPNLILSFISKTFYKCGCPVSVVTLTCDSCGVESHFGNTPTNPYVSIAFDGTNFGSFSQKSTHRSKSMSRILSLKPTIDFVLLLARLMVTVVLATASIVIFMCEHTNLYLYTVLVLLISVATYYASCSFNASYQMAVDTYLWCVCNDDTINDGSTDRPYYNDEARRALLERTETEDVALNREREASPNVDDDADKVDAV